jgi:hypothetical protein
VSEGSLPETIKKTAADVKRLAKLQAELAKQRFQAQARKKGMFAGMGAGGAFLLLYAVLFLFAAGAAGLAIVFPLWLALLIVGGGLLVLAAILVSVGVLGLKGSPKRSTEDEAARPEGEDQPWLRAKSS